MTERVDLRHVAGAADKRVVCRHAAIVFETERFAAVIAGVLRAVLLLTLADGEKDEAVAIKGDAPAEVGLRLAPRVGDEDLPEIRHAVTGPPRACQHGGGPLVRPSSSSSSDTSSWFSRNFGAGRCRAGRPVARWRPRYALDWLRIRTPWRMIATVRFARSRALRHRAGMPGSTDAKPGRNRRHTHRELRGEERDWQRR